MAKSMRIKTDDQVIVKSGKDAGKTGRVIRTDPKSQRVFIENLNIIKRHQRPRSVKDSQRGGETGGVIEKEGPIHVSNVALLDPKDNKATRVGMRVNDAGRRVRYSKRSGNSLDRWKLRPQTPRLRPLCRLACARPISRRYSLR